MNGFLLKKKTVTNISNFINLNLAGLLKIIFLPTDIVDLKRINYLIV